MRFDDLDRKMRVYETAHDFCVLPAMPMVARLDGRGFTKLTKETYPFEAPFDVRFRDMMADTVRYLMQDCGFSILYGYCQSDEISLLFEANETAFGRKTRKLLSVLAGEASAKFSLQLGGVACFDARISELPNAGLVLDYFRWRNEDAHRNALSAHCYWLLRKAGQSAQDATRAIQGLSTAAKNELLFQHGINFNELPAWQKRGCGFFWESYTKQHENPHTGESIEVTRRRLATEYELPLGEAYAQWLERLMQEK